MKNSIHLARLLSATAVVAVIVPGSTLRAADDDAAETIKALRQRLEELDQKIRVLERKNELRDEASAGQASGARTNASPILSIGSSGFTLSSADTNFVLKLKGVLQLDSRTFINDNPRLIGNDGFLLRRARPILDGTVFRDFDFQFMLD